ncbi:MAG TPA: PVC-type heme-binding CxxCH protein [Humisphaera sp.]|jgi:putative heme-binding domain-containing protein|nr:PVC-type heme-binding CxxCH protein [Humisphaera sp.]
MQLFIGLLLAPGLSALPAIAAVDKSDPEVERASFKVADGFEVNLFAADPMIRKPIQMNFDVDGKLWVVSSSTYPQIKPGEQPHDQVIVLEDTTGSGKADKSTVFADGLFIPTGVLPGDGGVYVANSTEIVFFKDTKGTGHADVRRVVLSGFGTEDTHHIIHAFRWGPDGRFYFNQSIYIHSHIETPWGTKHLLGSGTWRFRPETMELEVYCRGQVNPWGIAWDEWGQTLETDGAGFEGPVWAFPGSAFQSAVGYDHVLPGMNHGSPKYASLEILSGRHIPKDMQGVLLTNDFRANRIVRFKLSDEGSGFVSKQLPDFITSTDVDFRPVDIKQGPDGAIYIADWYNPIIQHGEVDFRDPRRDHTHGRIWRVTAKGMPLAERPKLSGASVAELLDALQAPEIYTRSRAKLMMRERGERQIAPALAAWVAALSGQSTQTEHDRLEALWAYESMDVVEPQLLNAVLAAKDFRARAAAVQVLSHWSPKIPDALDLLKTAVDDEHPRVRLEAVRALAVIASPESVTIAGRILNHPMDGNLDFALWRTNVELESIWMPAYQAGTLKGWAAPAHLFRALRDVKSPAAIEALVQQLKSDKSDAATRMQIVDLIASIDSGKQAATLFDLASGGEISDAATRVHILAALETLGRQKHRPGNELEKTRALIAQNNPAIRAAALRLAGVWKLEALRPALMENAESSNAGEPIRAAAIAGLADLGGAQSSTELKKLDDPSNPPAIRRAAIIGLVVIDPKEAALRAAEMLATTTDETGAAALLRAFTGRTGGANALAAALSNKQISPDAAKLSLRFLQSLGTEETGLTALFRKSAGFSEGATKLSADQMKQMVAEVLEKGDAARGERIFRRRDAACYQCHAIGGAGGFLAPDLVAIGASGPVDYLIDSILDPNKAIKDGYQGVAVATRDGDVITGIKVRQDEKTVVLRDATRPQIEIPLDTVRAQREIGSLMPTGLADPLTHQEFLDLVRLLSELGKPGPYGPGSAQLVRRWRTMEAPPDSVLEGDLPASIAADGSNWMPAYSLVRGELPPDAFRFAAGRQIGYGRCELEVTTPGKIRLILGSAAGVTMWIDGKPVQSKNDLTVDMTGGIHALTFAVDFAKRGREGLRLELADAPGSAGQAKPVMGR